MIYSDILYQGNFIQESHEGGVSITEMVNMILESVLPPGQMEQ